MPNYSGNPKISDYGKATRFGAGNCPDVARRRACPPWSIRNAVRRIAGFDFPVSMIVERDPTLDELLDGFRASEEVITVAHVIAAQLWVRALEGNFSAMEKVTNLVDGPLKETWTTARPSLEELINTS